MSKVEAAAELVRREFVTAVLEGCGDTAYSPDLCQNSLRDFIRSESASPMSEPDVCELATYIGRLLDRLRSSELDVDAVITLITQLANAAATDRISYGELVRAA